MDEIIEKVRNGEVDVLDMRDLDSYMKGHIANSILAPSNFIYFLKYSPDIKCK